MRQWNARRTRLLGAIREHLLPLLPGRKRLERDLASDAVAALNTERTLHRFAQAFNGLGAHRTVDQLAEDGLDMQVSILRAHLKRREP